MGKALSNPSLTRTSRTPAEEQNLKGGKRTKLIAKGDKEEEISHA